jgi:hypothetical protein
MLGGKKVEKLLGSPMKEEDTKRMLEEESKKKYDEAIEAEHARLKMTYTAPESAAPKVSEEGF